MPPTAAIRGYALVQRETGELDEVHETGASRARLIRTLEAQATRREEILGIVILDPVS